MIKKIQTENEQILRTLRNVRPSLKREEWKLHMSNNTKYSNMLSSSRGKLRLDPLVMISQKRRQKNMGSRALNSSMSRSSSRRSGIGLVTSSRNQPKSSLIHRSQSQRRSSNNPLMSMQDNIVFIPGQQQSKKGGRNQITNNLLNPKSVKKHLNSIKKQADLSLQTILGMNEKKKNTKQSQLPDINFNSFHTTKPVPPSFPPAPIANTSSNIRKLNNNNNIHYSSQLKITDDEKPQHLSVAHIRHKSTSQYSHLAQKLQSKKKPYLSKPMLDHVFKNNAKEDLIQRMNNDDGDDDKQQEQLVTIDNMMRSSISPHQNRLNNTIDIMQNENQVENKAIIKEDHNASPPFNGLTDPNDTYKTESKQPEKPIFIESNKKQQNEKEQEDDDKQVEENRQINRGIDDKVQTQIEVQQQSLSKNEITKLDEVDEREEASPNLQQQQQQQQVQNNE